MVLLTGATGFVGQHLCDNLLQQGYALKALLRPDSKIDALKSYPKVQQVLANPFNIESMKEAFDKVEFIIHCAGVLKGLKYEDYYQGNVLYTANLIQTAKTYAPHLKKFIFISSQAVIGPSTLDFPKKEGDLPNPISFYGKTKLEAEQKIIQSGLPYIILRPSSIYGPKDHEFLPLFKMAKKGILTLPGNGKNVLNLIYVQDFINAILASLKSSQVNKTYHVCGGGIYSQKEVAQTALKISQKKGVIVKIPAFLAKGFGYFNTFLGKIRGKPFLLNHQKIKEALQKAWIMDCSKISQETNYQPQVLLEQGFLQTYQWYQEEGWL